jgi:hypothetical protein
MIVPLAHLFSYQLVARPWFVCDVVSVGLDDVGFYFFEGGKEFVSIEHFPIDFEVSTIIFCEIWADVLIVFVFGVESCSIYNISYNVVDCECAELDP